MKKKVESKVEKKIVPMEMYIERLAKFFPSDITTGRIWNDKIWKSLESPSLTAIQGMVRGGKGFSIYIKFYNSVCPTPLKLIFKEKVQS